MSNHSEFIIENITPRHRSPAGWRPTFIRRQLHCHRIKLKSIVRLVNWNFQPMSKKKPHDRWYFRTFDTTCIVLLSVKSIEWWTCYELVPIVNVYFSIRYRLVIINRSVLGTVRLIHRQRTGPFQVRATANPCHCSDNGCPSPLSNNRVWIERTKNGSNVVDVVKNFPPIIKPTLVVQESPIHVSTTMSIVLNNVMHFKNLVSCIIIVEYEYSVVSTKKEPYREYIFK